MELSLNRLPTDLPNTGALALQGDRVKENRARQAQSDVRNEAVYFSPVVRIDPETRSAIIQYRDSETGEVKNEFPNKRKVAAYETAQEPVKAAPDKAPAPDLDEKV